MQPIWTVLIVMVAFWLVFRMRHRRRSTPEPKVYARRIDGSQVKAFLHPQVGPGCLADHGVQYGKGFRRKEGPALPHDDGCRCRPAHFSFTSNEVFQGALRKPVAPDVSIPGLSGADAAALLDVLRSWNGAPTQAGANGPGGVDAALAAVDWSRFSGEHRAALELFLRERLTFLAAQPGIGVAQVQAPA